MSLLSPWKLLRISLLAVLAALIVYSIRTGPGNIGLSIVSVGVSLLFGIATSVYFDGVSETYREANARTIVAVALGVVGSVFLFGSIITDSDVAVNAFILGAAAYTLAVSTTEFVLAEA
jgi:hypothetical protein